AGKRGNVAAPRTPRDPAAAASPAGSRRSVATCCPSRGADTAATVADHGPLPSGSGVDGGGVPPAAANRSAMAATPIAAAMTGRSDRGRRVRLVRDHVPAATTPAAEPTSTSAAGVTMPPSRLATTAPTASQPLDVTI